MEELVLQLIRNLLANLNENCRGFRHPLVLVYYLQIGHDRFLSRSSRLIQNLPLIRRYTTTECRLSM
jgi:hypothetical protein